MFEFFNVANSLIGQLTLLIVSIIGAYKWVRHEWNRRND